jgi:hypothetical protein
MYDSSGFIHRTMSFPLRLQTLEEVFGHRHASDLLTTRQPSLPNGPVIVRTNSYDFEIKFTGGDSTRLFLCGRPARHFPKHDWFPSTDVANMELATACILSCFLGVSFLKAILRAGCGRSCACEPNKHTRLL